MTPRRRDRGSYTRTIHIEHPPRDVWADERVVVRRSPISGQGLFADRRIAASTVVVRLGGRLVDSADLRTLITSATADPGSSYVDTISVYDDLHLVMPPRSVAHFANHSCDPTLWHVGPYHLATGPPPSRATSIAGDRPRWLGRW